MSFYMTVYSDKSINYFPNNKPYCFFTHLQSSLKLHENWRVSLISKYQYMMSLTKKTFTCIVKYALNIW